MPIIQAVDRALQIIDLFDETHPELKITDISVKVGLHKSTVHSLLKTLQLHGYIEQNADNGKYRLGIKCAEKGHIMLQGLDIRNTSRRWLEYLSMRTGQTTHLVIADGNHGVYVDKVEGEKAAIRYSRIGRRVPLHSSASGKVLAAFSKPTELEVVLSDYDFRSLTPATIVNRDAFLADLQEIQNRGYALDIEENEPGVRCAAAPIFDHNGQLAASMSISTMVSGLDQEGFEQCIQLLMEATQQVSRQMGYIYRASNH
jgi:IclR family KDG regulon transcriptional repressor